MTLTHPPEKVGRRKQTPGDSSGSGSSSRNGIQLEGDD